MNIKALKLGMHNSKFADPTGLNKKISLQQRDLVRLVSCISVSNDKENDHYFSRNF